MSYELQATVREAQGTGASRACVAKVKFLLYCTVKIRKQLRLLWIIKPCSMLWKKNLSILV